EAGADDLRRDGDMFEVTCDPANFSKVQDALLKAEMVPDNSEITQLPKTTIDAADLETAGKILRLMEALDDHDDVQNVYCNLTMTDEVLAEMEKG
ncbi:MAG: YebC/PmpR family DNA-binding transcriptional regulator, partial [Thermomicrobiales bacterium]